MASVDVATEDELAEVEQIKKDAAKAKALERGHFGSTLEYIVATIGVAIGLGNVWRFPYMVYEYGGGAFFIPYCVMIILVGLPIFILEAWIGQYTGFGTAIACGRMVPIARGFGWTMAILPFFISFYYSNILAIVLRYFAASIASPGWEECGYEELGSTYNTKACFTQEQFKECREQKDSSVTFWNNECVDVFSFCEENENICKDKVSTCVSTLMKYANRTHCKNQSATDDSFKFVRVEDAVEYQTAAEEYFTYQVTGLGDDPSWGDYGIPHWDLVLCLLAVWIMTGLVISFGPDFMGKVMTFLGIFPFFILVLMLIYVSTLPGVMDGIIFYLKPDTSKGLQLGAWNAAMRQIFFSLSLGQNLVHHFSSYNRFYSNIPINSAVVTISDTGMSILAGFVVFMVLGYYAFISGKEVTDVVSSGFSLAFVTFPEATNHMPGTQLWAALFFILLYIVGLNSNFAFLETVVGSLVDEFPYLLKWKKWLVLVFSLMGFVCGFSMSFDRGMLMVEMIDNASSQLLLLTGLGQTIMVSYVFGYSQFEETCEEMFMGMNIVVKWYLRLMLCFITPLLLLWGVTWTYVGYKSPHYEEYQFEWPLVLLWWLIYLAIVMPTFLLGAYEVYDIVFAKGRSWKELFRPTALWGPAEDALVKELAMQSGNLDEGTRKIVDENIVKAIRRKKARV
ncbi:unnamed protein product [Cyprideis torosa]|uniref:Transporter n=1 Tax=Cyprideis torosa TaxID=163714 RepID=A0A7R8WAK6_9CRUS|nr:unnamed protein product [Cyprideis torosa]CAG0891129.1 unnamed protein product [Cyprideis torosa]